MSRDGGPLLWAEQQQYVKGIREAAEGSVRMSTARLPTIWEYFTPGGYRPASRLTGDLSKVSRYVAIDLFFTSSPLYPPQFTPRLLPNKINLDINTVEGILGTNSSGRYQTPGLLVDEISELHRLPYTIDQ